MSYVKIGVAGPVGSGKTALIEALSRKMAKDTVLVSSQMISTQKKMPSSLQRTAFFL